jgi:hypothetical protein
MLAHLTVLRCVQSTGALLPKQRLGMRGIATHAEGYPYLAMPDLPACWSWSDVRGVAGLWRVATNVPAGSCRQLLLQLAGCGAFAACIRYPWHKEFLVVYWAQLSGRWVTPPATCFPSRPAAQLLSLI